MLLRLIKHVDIFPHDVKITYKEHSSFKTIFGGLVSIVIICGFVFLLFISVRIFTYDKTLK